MSFLLVLAFLGADITIVDEPLRVEPPFGMSWDMSKSEVLDIIDDKEDWTVSGGDRSSITVETSILDTPVNMVFLFPPDGPKRGLISVDVSFSLYPSEDSCVQTVDTVLENLQNNINSEMSINIRHPGEGLFTPDDMCMCVSYNDDAIWMSGWISETYIQYSLPGLSFPHISSEGTLTTIVKKGEGLQSFQIILTLMYVSDYGVMYITEFAKRETDKDSRSLGEL